MINYARLRKELNKFDVSLSEFVETVQMAEVQQRCKYITSLWHHFCEEHKAEALKKAQCDIKVMDWSEIYQLAVDFEVGVDLAITKSKEDKHDWRAMEDKLDREF